MKKMVVLAGLLAIGFSVFAADVAVNEKVTLRVGNGSFADADETNLSRLRSDTSVNVAGEHYNFFYQGRIDNPKSVDEVGKGLITIGSSEINLKLFWKYATFGVGSGFAGEMSTPVTGKWGTDFYTFQQGLTAAGCTAYSKTLGDWGDDGAYCAMDDGMFLKVTPIEGLAIAVGVPFQDWTSAAGDRRIGAAANFANDVFAAGLAYNTSFDNEKNPWNLGAGFKLTALDIVKPELSFAMIQNGTNYKTRSNKTIEKSAINWSVRAPLFLLDGKFTVTPGFEMVILTPFGKDDTGTDYSDFFAPGILAMLPVSYKINDVASVGLDLAFSKDVLKEYNKKDINAIRVFLGPNASFNTSVGTFGAKVNLTIDNFKDESKEVYKQDGTGCGWCLEVSYSTPLN